MEIYESRLSHNVSKFDFENVRDDDDPGNMFGVKFSKKHNYNKRNNNEEDEIVQTWTKLYS